MKAFNVREIREIRPPHCELMETIKRVEAERRVQFPHGLYGYRITEHTIIAPGYFRESLLVDGVVLQFVDGTAQASHYTTPFDKNLGKLTFRHGKIHHDTFLFKVSSHDIQLLSASQLYEDDNRTMEIEYSYQFALVFDRLTNLIGICIGLYCGRLTVVPIQMFLRS